MSNRLLLPLLLLPLSLSAAIPKAEALPGDSRTEVIAWIRAHPTLRPAPGEILTVSKSDTPAQRFTFQASFLPPGSLVDNYPTNLIRSEKIEIFDLINGVSRERLEEALRIIYGQAIAEDYRRAEIVFEYPTQDMRDRAENQNQPNLALLEGQLREGDRFGYWVEVLQDPGRGFARTGTITVFLREDLDQLEVDLRNR